MRRVAALIASLLISGFAIAPAHAHAELESMTPAIGSTVTSAPESVTLTFGEDVTTIGSTIVVLDPNGNAMQSGDARVDGATIAVDLLPLTVDGTYHVNFRVVSTDGHVVDGSETFELAIGEPQVTATADTVLTPSPETSAVTADSATIGFWILGLLVLLTGFGAVIAWRVRR